MIFFKQWLVALKLARLGDKHINLEKVIFRGPPKNRHRTGHFCLEVRGVISATRVWDPSTDDIERQQDSFAVKWPS